MTHNVLLLDAPSYSTAIVGHEANGQPTEGLNGKAKEATVKMLAAFFGAMVKATKAKTVVVRASSLWNEWVDKSTGNKERSLSAMAEAVAALKNNLDVEVVFAKTNKALELYLTHKPTHYVGLLAPTVPVGAKLFGNKVDKEKSTHFQANIGRMLMTLEGRPVKVAHYFLQWGATVPQAMTQEAMQQAWNLAERDSRAYGQAQRRGRDAAILHALGLGEVQARADRQATSKDYEGSLDE